jgi:hypothetical protein
MGMWPTWDTRRSAERTYDSDPRRRQLNELWIGLMVAAGAAFILGFALGMIVERLMKR